MMAFKEKFKEVAVQLDGSTFENCEFDRCTFIFNGVMPPHLKNNTFKDCKWEFGGNADMTLGYIAALYHGGMKDVVERTFESIRKSSSGRRMTDPTIG
jgi:hypothetical protein